MQGYTHFLAGALMEREMRRRGLGGGGRVAWVVLAGIVSHVLIDNFAVMTYHPPDARLRDPFWVGYHLFVALASLAAFVTYRKYWLGMICAVIPDFDWIIRPLAGRWGGTWWESGSLHGFFRGLPGLNALTRWMSGLPRWTDVPAAALIEVGLAGLLLAVLWRRKDAPRDATCPDTPSP